MPNDRHISPAPGSHSLELKNNAIFAYPPAIQKVYFQSIAQASRPKPQRTFANSRPELQCAGLAGQPTPGADTRLSNSNFGLYALQIQTFIVMRKKYCSTDSVQPLELLAEPGSSLLNRPC